MSVCCCPPQYQAVTWVMYVASAGAGRGRDPAGSHCPVRDSPVGFSFGKGFVSFTAHVQALLPNLPRHLQPVGASQGLHRSCSTHTAVLRIRDGSLPSYPCGHFAPRRTAREAPVPTPHSQPQGKPALGTHQPRRRTQSCLRTGSPQLWSSTSLLQSRTSHLQELAGSFTAALPLASAASLTLLIPLSVPGAWGCSLGMAADPTGSGVSTSSASFQQPELLHGRRLCTGLETPCSPEENNSPAAGSSPNVKIRAVTH